jgi:hypothetical protein
MKACPASSGICSAQNAIKCHFFGEMVHTTAAEWQIYAKRYHALPPALQEEVLAAMSRGAKDLDRFGRGHDHVAE